MTRFDNELRLRLEHLAAAVPTAAAPSTAVGMATRKSRRLQLALLIAATLLLVAATSLVTTATRPPRTPAQQTRDAADEELVRNDLGAVMENRCLNASQAKALIRARLVTLGLADWSIRADDSIRDAPCVGAAAVGDSHEVILTPSMGAPVAKALDALQADLMGRCLGREDAANLLHSTLVNAGAQDPKIEVGGVRGVPLEYGDAYLKHIQDGCYVYGGAQFDGTGRYTWFLSGQ